jgi:hypothetical protein
MDFPAELEASLTFIYSTKDYVDSLDSSDKPTIEGFREWMRDELIEDLGTTNVVFSTPTPN